MLACAESLTGGRVASILTSKSGSSTFFAGGVVAYNLEQKVNILHVNEEEARICNCVSASIAEQMAIGVSQLMDADYTVATTGYAEPYNGIEAHAWICVFDRKRLALRTWRVNLNGSRASNQNTVANLAAQSVLDVLS